MNERIRELAFKASSGMLSYDGEGEWRLNQKEVEKFVELIVQECIEQGKKVQSQTVSNASNDYNEGRKMGIEVFMNQIKNHIYG